MSPTTPSRRSSVGRTSVAAAAGLAAVLVSTIVVAPAVREVQAAGTHSRGYSLVATIAEAADVSIVGDWRARVRRSDGVVERDPTLTFFSDGRVDIANADGIAGTGTWVSTGPEDVAFDIRQPLRDESGAEFGYVLVHQDVKLSRNQFKGAGYGTGYDNSGQVLSSSTSTIVAQRLR